MINLQQKFNQLKTNGSAILATNFYNYETADAVVKAASSVNQPIILQASPGTIEYLGAETAMSLAKSIISKHEAEAWLHLDHAESLDLIKKCLDLGFDSVMIDASDKPMKENIEITKKVVMLAENYDANVEAELGYVAKLGQSHDKEGFTKPEEARIFVEETGVTALAVAIGSAHGFYKKEPDLDLELLKQIHHVTGCALVLHGSSGIPENQIRDSIRYGIRKINLATEIKDTFMQTLKIELEGSDEIDLRKVFPPAMQEVINLVQHKLSVISNNETVIK